MRCGHVSQAQTVDLAGPQADAVTQHEQQPSERTVSGREVGARLVAQRFHRRFILLVTQHLRIGMCRRIGFIVFGCPGILWVKLLQHLLSLRPRNSANRSKP